VKQAGSYACAMRWLPALFCLIVLARAAPALGQSEIHRCIGRNGGAVFTDQPCAALQATPVTATALPDAAAAPAGPPPILCAANRADLQQSVVDAFARHDANRLAGLMLWNGYGRGSAVADIGALRELMRRPLLDIQPSDDAAENGDDPPAADSDADPFAAEVPPAFPAGDRLVLHIAGNDGSGSPRVLRFSITRRSGCLWLRNAQ
jgi:hypothetical protein